MVVTFRQCAIKQLIQDDWLSHHLFGCGGVTVMEEVPASQFGRINAEFCSDLIHVAFDGEDGLWCAKTAKRAVGHGICSPRARSDAHVGAHIRPRRMQRSPRKHGGRQCGVRASVGGNLDIHGQQFAFVVERGAVAHAGRMAFCGCGQILHAVVDHFHWMPALHCQQCGMSSQQRRIVLFASKGAARLGLDNPDFFCR